MNDVDHVLGFFEDLGTARNCALLDDEVFVRSFGHAPVQIFMEAWWYICWARHGELGHESRIFGEFEKMVRWLRATASFADTPNPAIRLLVLPSDPETAGWGAWNLCRDLSKALSEYPAMGTQSVREGVGATIRPLVATGATGLFSEVVAVPPLDVGTEDWTTELEEATRLLDHLQKLDPSGVRTLIQRL